MEGLTIEQQQYARSVIKEELLKVLPVSVRVSFGVGHDAELGAHAIINVFWPKYILSWMGKPEQHKLRAQELVRLSFNRNWFTRFVGLMVAPFVQNYIASNPIILLPRTELEYPEGRMRLRVLLGEQEQYTDGFDEYFHGLVEMWAQELRSTVLKERGAQEL